VSAAETKAMLDKISRDLNAALFLEPKRKSGSKAKKPKKPAIELISQDTEKNGSPGSRQIDEARVPTHNGTLENGSLTESEQRKLNDLEGIVEKGLQTFVEVGAALSIIREQKLFRATHLHFEEYVRDRWDFTDRRARQLIASSEVVLGMGDTGRILPVTKESHAVELTSVPKEKRAEVWETATKAAEAEGKKTTAKHVRQAATTVVPRTAENVRRHHRKPVDRRVRDLVVAAQDMSALGDDDLAVLQTNDLMIEGLRRAVGQITRIIDAHERAL
jgi:hypothetical protein